jgi:hypothetical protein
VNLGDKSGRQGADDEEATTLDHTAFDETTTTNQPSGNPADESFFDVVEQDVVDYFEPQRQHKALPSCVETPPRRYQRSIPEELGARSADSSSYYISDDRTSESSGLPIDSLESVGSNASAVEADANPTANMAAAVSVVVAAAKAPPASPFRRDGHRHMPDKKDGSSNAVADDDEEGAGRVGIRPFVVPEDVAQSESRSAAAGAGALDQDYHYFIPTESNIVLPALEDDQARDEGKEVKERAGAATTAAFLEQPVASIDSSLAMYDEDLYYQRAQEILHAALLASSQQRLPHSKSANAEETEEEVEEEGGMPPTTTSSTGAPIKDSAMTSTSSPSQKLDGKTNVLPTSSGNLVKPIRSRDKADLFGGGGANADTDDERLVDGHGGTYEDDDTIATEEATDHVPTPCPSEEDHAARAAPPVHHDPPQNEPVAGNGSDGISSKAGAQTVSAASVVVSEVLPQPASPRRQLLPVMARSPSHGDSPVVQSSKVIVSSKMVGDGSGDEEIKSNLPDALAPAHDPSSTVATTSVQETLRKLERMNLQRRADRATFDSPKHERTTAGKSLEHPGLLRMTKSSDDADEASHGKSRHANELKSAIATSSDASSEVYDFPEIQKSPSSPPAFSAMEAQSRPLQKKDGTPPPIPRLASKSAPPPPPPSPIASGHQLRALLVACPPPAPPQSAPVAPSPAGSVPTSPASSTASPKMKTLISKFESAPVKLSNLGPRKIHPKDQITTPPVIKPSLPEATMTAAAKTSASTSPVKLSTTGSSSSDAPPSHDQATAQAASSRVAATRAAYTQSLTKQPRTASTIALPPAPAHTPESSPRSYGKSVRKVPSSRRGFQGVQTYPSPRDGLIMQHVTAIRFAPNASPPSESARQPSVSASRTSSTRYSFDQTMDLTPPALTQQRRANVPITSKVTSSSTPSSSFFWRSHPASSRNVQMPELAQQPSLESNDEGSSLSSPDPGKGQGSGGERGRRLDDYERMLRVQRQEARRRYEEANKPPWAKMSR